MSNIIVCIWFFIVGTVLGSFYNVLIDRLPAGRNVIIGRSECDGCHRVIKWYDMIPVISFLILRGRCRYCHKKLSVRYLISELFTGIMFAAAFLLSGSAADMNIVALLSLWSMLFVVAVIDYRNGYILDIVVIIFSVIGIAAMLLTGTYWLDILLGIAGGGVLYGVIYVAARLIFRKEGFGQGDVVFMAGVGAFFGLYKALITGFLAFYCCIIFIIIKVIREKVVHRKTEIPFGPSIACAALIMSVFGDQILQLFKNCFNL